MAEFSGESYWLLSASASTTFLAFIIIFFLAGIARRKRREPHTLPPGSRGWPLIGDTFAWLNAVSGSHPSSFVEQQIKKYGRIFSCSLFGKWAVVSADPAFNRFIMQNEGKLFQSSYPKSFRDLVGKDGVITVHGDQQRRLHSIASSMMRHDQLKTHFLEDIPVVMLQTLSNCKDGEVVLLQDICRKVAIHLMVNQLLGVSSESEVNEMSQLFSDFVDGCLSVPIDLPGFTYHKAMKARKEIIRKINKTIEKRLQNKATSDTAGNGVLGRLLEEESLPNESMADFIINLLFAGNETTAKTMLFAVYFLTHCPKAMTQLLEEHDRLAGGTLTWQDYKTMDFTQCVIDETLRLGGIAIWLMREAKEDVSYQDYVIPKGCFVVPFLSAVHLDESYYKESLSFNPWRWLDPETQQKRNWRTSPFYCPFGGGTRFCPGAELARLQIALFLHYFITTYRWTQLKEDRISFFPSARLVNGFKIQLNRRDNAPQNQ
ncbi:PREDICTED: abietadienol/abietadienal oxidase [Camelina sativa]|uniref:Abietadienol/abietadienal oxidase n=1 Tax=Camelina sativa TaxID=90675 RepID=A0ABM1QE59_CAMSA|nr:PREDICTED: abietadienol/abietadienal oxidase [Camelina sativa]